MVTEWSLKDDTSLQQRHQSPLTGIGWYPATDDTNTTLPPLAGKTNRTKPRMMRH